MKVLVCGDVEGQFINLYTKVNVINKKNGPFDILLCCGNYFNPKYSDDDDLNKEWQHYKDGSIRSYKPSAVNILPTLILGPTSSTVLPYYQCSGKGARGGELCENVTYLGDSGVYTMANGVTIAYLSGVQTFPKDYSGQQVSNEARSTYNTGDVQNVISQVKQCSSTGVDILLTSQWPFGVHHYTDSSDEVAECSEKGSPLISLLCQQVKPRYHFVALNNVHYERYTYRNHEVLKGNAEHVSRFIALAKFGNKDKRKCVYAFSLEPLSSISSGELCKQPEDVTECPYKHNAVVQKMKVQQDANNDKDKEPVAQQFFYDMTGNSRRGRGGGRGRGMGRGGQKRFSGDDGFQNAKQPKPGGTNESCWFCLGSSQVEKHLVVNVGEECYLALAKGYLTESHILILPISHYRSLLDMTESVIEEIGSYKKKLRKFYKALNKVPIYWERNFKTQHAQIQAIAVDKRIDKDTIKSAFLECAIKYDIMMEEMPDHADLHQYVQGGVPYFYVELPGKVKLFCQIQRGQNFPLQFGREAVCDSKILDLDAGKIDWKNCNADKELEKNISQKLRKLYEPCEDA